MSKLSLKVLLGVFALMFSANSSYSFPIECTNVDPTPLFSTFSSPQAAKSWLPKKVVLRESSIKYFNTFNKKSSKENSWTVFFRSTKVMAKYMPVDKKLRVQLVFQAAYKQVAPVYYTNCVDKSRSTKKTTTASTTSKASNQNKLKSTFMKKTSTDRKNIQSALSELGLYTSTIDGLYGKGTEAALKAYNKEYLGNPDLRKLTNALALLKDILAPQVSEVVPWYKDETNVKLWNDDAICTWATSNYQWKTSEDFKLHVAEAKERGLDCGVSDNQTAVKNVGTSCSDNVSKCSAHFICKRLKEDKKYLKEAKSRSLACAETMTAEAQQQCRYNASICGDRELCRSAAHKGSWRLVTKRDHVAEAKKRGLSCGVALTDISEQTAAVEQPEPNQPSKLDIAEVKASYDAKDYNKAFADAQVLAVQGDPEAQLLLGKMFADGRGTLQVSTVAHMWFNIASMGGIDEAYEERKTITAQMTPSAVEEAQKMAMKCIQSNYADCGLAIQPAAVKQPKPVAKTYITSGSQVEAWFKDETQLKRKQLHYALKKLGVYPSSVDGLWGANTSRAFTRYIKKYKSDAETVNELFASVLSKVKVPIKFAEPKLTTKNKTTNRSDNAGLTAIVSNPSMSGKQALAVCGPQAQLAGSRASSSYQAPNYGSSTYCTGFGYSVNCNTRSNSGGLWGGLAEGLAAGLTGRAAREATMKSCLAQYGWKQ
jgi:peptidoglycan hydrolase-like protein with peptidoglycan-binding domain/TPR repeat protein